MYPRLQIKPACIILFLLCIVLCQLAGSINISRTNIEIGRARFSVIKKQDSSSDTFTQAKGNPIANGIFSRITESVNSASKYDEKDLLSFLCTTYQHHCRVLFEKCRSRQLYPPLSVQSD